MCKSDSAFKRRPSYRVGATPHDEKKPPDRRGKFSPLTLAPRQNVDFSHSEKRPTTACVVFQQIQGGPQILYRRKSVGLPESAGKRCEKCGLNPLRPPPGGGDTDRGAASTSWCVSIFIHFTQRCIPVGVKWHFSLLRNVTAPRRGLPDCRRNVTAAVLSLLD